jgi:hypothetical protein
MRDYFVDIESDARPPPHEPSSSHAGHASDARIFITPP